VLQELESFDKHFFCQAVNVSMSAELCLDSLESLDDVLSHVEVNQGRADRDALNMIQRLEFDALYVRFDLQEVHVGCSTTSLALSA